MSKMEMQDWQNSRFMFDFFKEQCRKWFSVSLSSVCLLQALFIYCDIYLHMFDLIGALHWCLLLCAIHGLKIANTYRIEIEVLYLGFFFFCSRDLMKIISDSCNNMKI